MTPLPRQPLPERVPLPINQFDRENDAASHDAYQYCCNGEIAAGNDLKLLAYHRCLGYLLLEAHSDGARNAVSYEIIECFRKHGTIERLAELYINCLFCLFRQKKSQTSVASDTSSRDSFEIDKNFFDSVIEKAPTDYRSAKRSALVRDRFRCVISGWVEMDAFENLTDPQQQEYDIINSSPAPTIFSYILSPLTSQNLNPQDDSSARTKYAGTVWAIVDGFCGIDVLEELSGDKIHRLSNGLTLSTQYHAFFSDLKVWFEEVPNSLNVYTIHATHPRYLGMLPNPHNIVSFSTNSGLDPPDPRYLKLHATICRVAHISGAAAYLRLQDKEMEETGVMAGDGSSADLLVSRLSGTPNCAVFI